MGIIVCTLQRPRIHFKEEIGADEHKTPRVEMYRSFDENDGRRIAWAARDCGGRMAVDEFPNYESYMNYRTRLEQLRFFLIFEVETHIGVDRMDVYEEKRRQDSADQSG
jgi:hypothetical protein